MTITAPKARPILFSGPMVRALLAGRKTQTRRIVKPQPRPLCSHVEPFRGEGGGWIAGDNTGRIFHCPYGKPGDLLWARETWGDDKQFGGKLYRATHEGDDPIGSGWRPSIHMPRSASRLTLELTGVKIERLNDISKADVIAEGITERDGGPIEDAVCGWHEPYAALWEKLNGAGSWEANPWVWALAFRVHTVNVDEFMKQVEAA